MKFYSCYNLLLTRRYENIQGTFNKLPLNSVTEC